jgi:hypothetical protein
MFASPLLMQMFDNVLYQNARIFAKQNTPARIKGNSHQVIGIPTALPILIFTGIRATCAPSNDFERITRR